jgi:hypothetical protein
MASKSNFIQTNYNREFWLTLMTALMTALMISLNKSDKLLWTEIRFLKLDKFENPRRKNLDFEIWIVFNKKLLGGKKYQICSYLAAALDFELNPKMVQNEKAFYINDV